MDFLELKLRGSETKLRIAGKIIDEIKLQATLDAEERDV